MSGNVTLAESLSREELYEQAWSQPMTKVAKTYGLSEASLAKICRKLNIPTPGRGYWWKLELGIPLERTPLPPLENAEEKRIQLNRVEKPGRPQKELTETERKVAAEKEEENRIRVRDQLISPHPLVERTLRSLSCAKADLDGRVRPKAKECLDVCVGPDSIDRAMRIMDTLIKALEYRGYAVTTSDEKEGETRASVSGEAIRFSLVELIDRREKELTPVEKREREEDRHHLLWSSRPEYDRLPSGRLSLSIDDCPNLSNGKRTWSDGLKQRVEDRLNRFVASLIQAAEDRKESRRRHEEWERQRKEAEKRRLEEEQRKREEKWRRKMLEMKLAEWQQVERLRAFIASVRTEAIRRHGEIQDGTEIARWLAWAERHTCLHDPLAEGNELPMYMPDEEALRRLEWGSHSYESAWSPPGQPR